jgi:hypothetical protein
VAIAAIILSSSGAADTPSSSADSRARTEAVRVSAPEKCKHARKAVVFYRGQFHAHRARLGAGRPTKPASTAAACSQVRFLAHMWRSRAYIARVSADAVLYFRKVRSKTLKDFRVTPGNSAWRRAVQEAQRAYPGTDSWLLSCSASEGGWGRGGVGGCRCTPRPSGACGRRRRPMSHHEDSRFRHRRLAGTHRWAKPSLRRGG